MKPRDSLGSGVAAPSAYARGAFALVLGIAFLANALRNVSTDLPHQLSDETVFLLGSKYFLQWDLIQSLGYVPYPGLVFLKLASLIASSPHYYALIKVWNAFCLTLAAIPAFFVARSVMPSAEAGIASLVVVFTPPTIYGAYFTPESTYFLGFWIFAALATVALRTPRRYDLALATGVAGALTYLIKPHALALLAGYAIAAVGLALSARWRSARSRLRVAAQENAFTAADTRERKWSPSVLAMNIACFGFGIALALLLLGRILGTSWLAAFDFRVYTNLVDGTTSDPMQRKALLAFATLFALHAAAIVAAAAIPLALFAAFAAPRAEVEFKVAVLVLFAAAVLSMQLLMTVKASLDFHEIYGGSNTLDRLNARYYSYALPLLVFAVLARVRQRASAPVVTDRRIGAGAGRRNGASV